MGSVVVPTLMRSWLARPGARPDCATWLLADVEYHTDIRRIRRAIMRGRLVTSASRALRSKYDGMCSRHPALRDPCIFCDIAYGPGGCS